MNIDATTIHIPSAEEAFLDNEKIISIAVMKFWRAYKGYLARCGISKEEVKSEANWIFFRSYRSWEPERSELGKRIRFCVENGLLDMLRKVERRRKNYQLRTENDPTPDNVSVPDRFRLEQLLGEVSPTAGEVIRLALDRASAPRADKLKRGKLVDVLLELGWAGQAICDAFNEIREALIS